jgi:hypothetical protein
MNDNKIPQPIADLFDSRYPKSKFESKSINDIIIFKSTFDKEKQFVDFIFKKNSITTIKTNNKYLPEVKKLLSINKMKRSDFKIIDDFFTIINLNSNFNKIFYTENRVLPTEICSFKREGTTSSFTLPFIANTHSRTYLITKIRKSYFMYYLENHFKMTRDGTILIVPMITLFEHQKNEHVFAFNIYDQSIHRIRNEEFYFEDLFANNEPFNPDYHGDVFVDEYIDNYILNTLDDDDEIRESLIVLPRDRLSEKVDILSMYMI